MSNNDGSECEECGCIGNESCGAEPIGGDCALDSFGVCPCCKRLGKFENRKRWPDNPDNSYVNPDQMVLEL